jgi:HK97 family phage major capsid protein
MSIKTETEIRDDIQKLARKIQDIEAKAHEYARDLTDEERGLKGEMESEIEKLKRLPPAPLTLGANPLFSSREARVRGGGYELRGPAQSKDYRSLFGADGYEWPDRDTSFFSAVFSGRHHPGLTIRAMTESVPSDGGFLVPVQYAQRIHAVSLENEIVMPRCYVQPMVSNTIKIPAMEIGSHASSLFGGFTASYVAETGTISEADPKTRSMELNCKKLTGLIRFSSELAADIPGGESQVINICGKGLSWYRDRAFLKGTGVGEPLGILNAPCLVEVAKESGQKAGTIIYENLVKMMARAFAGSFQNSFWVAHQTTIPQLLSLSIAIGVGGSHIPVMTRTGNGFEILTRPVVFTEKTETLGSKGDILLADFSQYVVGLRGEMRFDTSIHVHFSSDELLARLIERHDGQPLWSKALTLADGVTTVSPFVTLAART